MTQYTLISRPGGPQSLAAHFRQEENLLPLLGIEPRFLSNTAYSLVTIPTSLLQLTLLSTTNDSIYVSCNKLTSAYSFCGTFSRQCHKQKPLFSSGWDPQYYTQYRGNQPLFPRATTILFTGHKNKNHNKWNNKPPKLLCNLYSVYIFNFQLWPWATFENTQNLIILSSLF
jgi:hypothetical protein